MSVAHKTRIYCAVVSLFSLGVSPALAQDSATPQAFLDVSSCASTGDGTSLMQALTLEAASVGEVAIVQQHAVVQEQAVGQLQTTGAGLLVIDCNLQAGSVLVEVQRADATAPQTHRLDLVDVPEPARSRTAAVALLEWARSLTTHGAGVSSTVVGNVSGASPTPRQRDIAPQHNNEEGQRFQDSPATSEPKKARGPEEPPRLILEVGVGFQMTHEPTPLGLRLDALADVRLAQGFRYSLGLHASYMQPESPFGSVTSWWWGGELGLGHAWGKRAELSLWGVGSFDGVTVRGTSFEDESSQKARPVVSASARFKARTVLDSGLVLGVAVDAGGFIQGARFTALGLPIADFSGFRGAARMIVGYAF